MQLKINRTSLLRSVRWKIIVLNLFAALGLLGIPHMLHAQPSPVEINVEAPDVAVAAGSEAQIKINFEIDEPWHIYSHTYENKVSATSIELEGVPGVTLGEISWPEARMVDVDGSGKLVGIHEGAFSIVVPVMLSSELPAGSLVLPLRVHYQACATQCHGQDRQWAGF